MGLYYQIRVYGYTTIWIYRTHWTAACNIVHLKRPWITQKANPKFQKCIFLHKKNFLLGIWKCITLFPIAFSTWRRPQSRKKQDLLTFIFKHILYYLNWLFRIECRCLQCGKKSGECFSYPRHCFFWEFLLLVPNSYPFPTHFWENVGIPT